MTQKTYVSYIPRKNVCGVLEAIESEKSNLRKQLGVYIDDEGIARCKVRVDEAKMSERARRPELL